MKIVIDIDDKVYGLVKRFDEGIRLIEKENDTVETAIMRAIINGTPLPKGYGKLIDENELKKEAIRCEWSRSMYSMLEHTLSYMKPIIEAEGSDSE